MFNVLCLITDNFLFAKNSDCSGRVGLVWPNDFGFCFLGLGFYENFLHSIATTPPFFWKKKTTVNTLIYLHILKCVSWCHAQGQVLGTVLEMMSNISEWDNVMYRAISNEWRPQNYFLSWPSQNCQVTHPISLNILNNHFFILTIIIWTWIVIERKSKPPF